jgi:calcium-dependent protein kinase
VLQAISYCHENNVAHRDLKPENLLLDSKHNNTIKVIDFGTSSEFEAGSKMKEIYGTAYYIAPEVLSFDYNEKCDIWSIGVILYILLSGRPPFDGNDDKEIIKKVRIGHYDLTSPEFQYVTKEALDILKKMLTYDPMRRISAGEALKHPWIIKKAYEDCDIEII